MKQFNYFMAALNLLNLLFVFLSIFNALNATTNALFYWNIFVAAINLYAFVRGYENIKECVLPQKVKVNGK